MIKIGNNNDIISNENMTEMSDNVIQFPKRADRLLDTAHVLPDPNIIVTTEDGRKLDKLGMSQDECCYILPPLVSVISLEKDEALVSSQAQASDVSEIMPVRVILSESDAVSEIGMDEDRGRRLGIGGEKLTHWISPGRTLYLARQSPDDVAMLSIKLQKCSHLPLPK